jgi:hypothetical protein
MSLLVNPDGSPRTYVVADTKARKIVASTNWIGHAAKGMKQLQAEGASDLAIHNLTHPKCPEWIQDLAKSDPAYCLGRAAAFAQRETHLRKSAAALIVDADSYQAHAATWRELAEAASAPSAPGM